MNSQILNFDMFAMVQPKNERDFEMMLDEAMAAICSVNEKLLDVLAIHGFSPRTRASAVHDLIVRNALTDERPELKVFNYRKMKGVLIDGRLVTRFKKLSEDGKSCSIPTKQVRDFRHQCSLPGFPRTHNLEIGYVLNEAQTEIAEVLVTQPSGKGVAWTLSISGSGMRGDVANIFSAPQAPNSGTDGAVIKVKESVQVATVLPFKKGES